MSSQTGAEAELLWFGFREIRDVGGSIGQSFDIEALRELGIATEDGSLRVEGAQVQTAIYEDGTVEVDLSSLVEQVDDDTASD